MIRILICDDHMLVAEGIELMLNDEPSIEVIKMVSSGTAALAYLSEENEADVLILDISMPEMDGVEVLKRIKDLGIEVNVLMLTMHNDITHIKNATAEGAQGYLLKTTGKTKLIEAIKKVAQGISFVDEKLTTVLMGHLHEEPGVQKNEPVVLTPRELEVLQLMVQNKKTKDIAELCFISVNTVLTHKKNIYSKLNIHSVSELINYAHKHQYIVD